MAEIDLGVETSFVRRTEYVVDKEERAVLRDSVQLAVKITAQVQRSVFLVRE